VRLLLCLAFPFVPNSAPSKVNQPCHSEERSDEESAFLQTNRKSRFLSRQGGIGMRGERDFHAHWWAEGPCNTQEKAGRAQEYGDEKSHGQEVAPPIDSTTDAKQLLDAAASLIGQSRYAEAVTVLEKAQAIAPSVASIHHYLGYALWKQDQWTSAQAEFEKANHLDPSNPYTLYFLARIAQSTGRLGESIRYYEGILRLGPAIYDLNQRLGQLYLDHGDYDKARQYIEAALKETPWESSLYYQLGRIDQKTGHPDAAREEFAAAERLKQVSQVAVEHLLALDRAVHERKQDEVIRWRAELLAEASQDPEILESVGVLLGRVGLYEGAREPLERSVKLDPSSFEANYNLGLTLLQLNLSQDAETSLLAALKLKPESVEANSALAVLYVQQNRNLDAIERLRVASQASPGDAKILALLGQQYLRGYFVQDALNALRRAVELAPQNLNARLLLVEACHAAHDYDEGFKVAQQTIGLFPHSGRARYQAAQELASLGRYQDAHPYAEEAVQKEPNLVEGWNLLGDLEAKSGKYGDALKAFERARGLDPSNVDAARGVAESLIRLERYDDALAELQQALKLHAEDAGLHFSLMQVYTRLGRREEAAKAAGLYQQLHAREAAEREAQAARTYTPPARDQQN
jgi:tetratricopeptide (TPR) repeat protein